MKKQAFLEDMLCATLKKTTMSLSQMYPGNIVMAMKKLSCSIGNCKFFSLLSVTGW